MPPPIVYRTASFTQQWVKPVSAEVVISAVASLTSTNMTGGSGPDGSILPPGWGGGSCPTHHNRGHLIGNKLGGPGNEKKNLVTLTAGTNHPFMYEFEDAVGCCVMANPGVNFLYSVECETTTPATVNFQASRFQARVPIHFACSRRRRPCGFR